MKLSFILPVFNEEKFVRACLDSILTEKSVEDEIIVVDNGSSDQSPHIVRGYQQVKLIVCPEVTVGKLRNKGAELAKGELLAFIDADCVISKGWRNNILEAFQKPYVSATGARYNLPQDARWVEKAWFSQRKNVAGKVNYINSGNLVVKRDTFRTISGFDEQLLSGEDAELCWRIRQAGGVIFENPQAGAVHMGNPKNVYQFFRQQKWHGMGMLGTLRIHWFDKPFIMTILFFLFLALAITQSCFGSGGVISRFFVSLALILFVPAVTALYRVVCFRNFRFFLPLFFLYCVYFTARLCALLKIIVTVQQKKCI